MVVSLAPATPFDRAEQAVAIPLPDGYHMGFLWFLAWNQRLPQSVHSLHFCSQDLIAVLNLGDCSQVCGTTFNFVERFVLKLFFIIELDCLYPDSMLAAEKAVYLNNFVITQRSFFTRGVLKAGSYHHVKPTLFCFSSKKLVELFPVCLNIVIISPKHCSWTFLLF